MSSIYLSYLYKQPHAQQLSTNTNFMSKHKISVGNKIDKAGAVPEHGPKSELGLEEKGLTN
jgi:hypothetical protein